MAQFRGDASLEFGCYVDPPHLNPLPRRGKGKMLRFFRSFATIAFI